MVPTTTRSPGSIRFTRQVSIPAVPVAEMGMVSRFLVTYTCRSISAVSAMISRNCGSRWPSSGVVMAVSTRGWASDGPGPRSRRGDGVSWPGMVMAVCGR